MPRTTAEAVELANAGALAEPDRIVVRTKAGEKFPRIIRYDLGSIPPRMDGSDEREPEESLICAWGSDDDMHLSSLCRQSSKHRSQRFRAVAAAEKLKALKQVSFAVDEGHRQEVQALMDSLGQAALGGSNEAGNGSGQLPILRDVLDGRKLCKQDSKDIVEAVAKRIVAHWGSTPEVMAGLQEILSPYMKSR